VTDVTGQLILLRHGESTWNRDGRFTGWADPGLTARGAQEAIAAGQALAGHDIRPHVVFTSMLARSVDTAAIVLDELRSQPPVRREWRLNERHYGALQGQHHGEAIRRYGAVRVERWRRNWSDTPPLMERISPFHPVHDPRYGEVPPADLPDGESLAASLRRQGPCLDEITALTDHNQCVLLVGHGNSLRALVAALDGVAPAAVPRLLIPTGVPQIFHHNGGWRRGSARFELRGTWTEP
jgi:2,3-bisphosphoglycerate-dependent phosphoglycerate mutase